MHNRASSSDGDSRGFSIRNPTGSNGLRHKWKSTAG